VLSPGGAGPGWCWARVVLGPGGAEPKRTLVRRRDSRKLRGPVTRCGESVLSQLWQSFGKAARLVA